MKQTADERKQLLTFLSRLHPAFCADQQRKTELLFHSGNAAADPGRCITQLFCRGGQTAGMCWDGELISFPYGRSVSDIIYITDSPEETEG